MKFLAKSKRSINAIVHKKKPSKVNMALSGTRFFDSGYYHQTQ